MRFIVLQVHALDATGKSAQRIGFINSTEVPPGAALVRRIRSGNADDAQNIARKESRRLGVPLIDTQAGETVVWNA